MVLASTITLGTIIGLWHGINVKMSILVPESSDGLMEAITITTFVKQMIYSIATRGFFMLTFVPSAEVKLLYDIFLQ